MSGPKAGLDEAYGYMKCRGSDGNTNPTGALAGFYQDGGFAGPGSVPVGGGVNGGAVVRNGAGSYTITLDPGIAAGQAYMSAQKDGIGATNTAELQITHTATTTVDVRTFSAGAAADANFWLMIRRTNIFVP